MRFSDTEKLAIMPSVERSSGTESDAGIKMLTHIELVQFFAFQRDRPFVGGLEAKNDVRQFGLPVTLHARNSHDLTLVNVKVDVVQRDVFVGIQQRDVFSESPTSPGAKASLWTCNSTGRPYQVSKLGPQSNWVRPRPRLYRGE